MAVGEGEEALDLVLLEETAVLLQFFSNRLGFGLGEFERVTVDDVASDILLEESDDFKGFLVVLDGFDEELVAVALVIGEDLDLPGDFVPASLVPGKIVLGFLEDLLEAGSVIDGLLEELLVEVLDLGELLDGLGTNPLISLVLLVGSILGVNVGLLKIAEKAKDGVDSVAGFGSGLR